MTSSFLFRSYHGTISYLLTNQLIICSPVTHSFGSRVILKIIYSWHTIEKFAGKHFTSRAMVKSKKLDKTLNDERRKIKVFIAK